MSRDVTGNGNLQGRYKQAYAPKLSEGNPEKKKKEDWFDELCKKHGAENLWKKNKN